MTIKLCLSLKVKSLKWKTVMFRHLVMTFAAMLIVYECNFINLYF